jgi:hypothetical protein
MYNQRVSTRWQRCVCSLRRTAGAAWFVLHYVAITKIWARFRIVRPNRWVPGQQVENNVVHKISIVWITFLKFGEILAERCHMTVWPWWFGLLPLRCHGNSCTTGYMYPSSMVFFSAYVTKSLCIECLKWHSCPWPVISMCDKLDGCLSSSNRLPTTWSACACKLRFQQLFECMRRKLLRMPTRMHAGMYVCVSIYAYTCIYPCVYVCVYVCIFSMYVCMYAWMYVWSACIHVHINMQSC